MKKLLAVVQERARKLFDVLACIWDVVVALVATYMFLQMWKPLLPTISAIATLTFALVGTLCAAKGGRVNANLSWIGLVLYGLSWPTTWIWGTWMGTVVWGTGVLLWFAAFGRGLQCNMLKLPAFSQAAT